MKSAFQFLIIVSTCLITFCMIGCALLVDGVVKPLNNNLPTVEDFSVPTLFDPGETLEFSIIAHDKDGDVLTYTWAVDAGKLNTISGTKVKWTAPEGFSSVNVIVSVSDKVGKPIVVNKMILNSQPNTFTGHRAQVLTAHTDKVFSVSFSSDGKTIASGSRDKTIRFWDVATGRHLQTITGHKSGITSISFSPDGKTIAAASGSRIYFWDIAAGTRLQTITGDADHFQELSDFLCVSFSPDGKTIASGGGHLDSTARIWDAGTANELHALIGHTESIWCVSFSPDGKLLASASRDGTIRIWDTATGAHLRTLTESSHVAHSVSFSPDGKAIASGSGDAVTLWDVATGKRLRTTNTGSAQITSVSFGPNGKTIVTGDSLDNVILWDAETGIELQKFTGHSEWIPSVSFSPDGSRLISGSGDGTIRLYN